MVRFSVELGVDDIARDIQRGTFWALRVESQRQRCQASRGHQPPKAWNRIHCVLSYSHKPSSLKTRLSFLSPSPAGGREFPRVPPSWTAEAPRRLSTATIA